jgi:hypothetical protein
MFWLEYLRRKGAHVPKSSEVIQFRIYQGHGCLNTPPGRDIWMMTIYDIRINAKCPSSSPCLQFTEDLVTHSAAVETTGVQITTE